MLFHPATLHSVLAGRRRSGKSVTAYRILAEAAMTPWVRPCGADPTGVLLGPAFAGKDSDFALGTSPAQIAHALDVLGTIEKLMDSRISRLMKVGIDQVPPHVHMDPGSAPCSACSKSTQSCWQPQTASRPKRPDASSGEYCATGSKAAVHVMTILQRPEAAVLHDRAQYARAIVHSVENKDTAVMLLPSATPEQITQLLEAQQGRGFLAEVGEPMRFIRADYVTYEQYAAIAREASAQKPPLLRQGADLSAPRQPEELMDLRDLNERIECAERFAITKAMKVYAHVLGEAQDIEALRSLNAPLLSHSPDIGRRRDRGTETRRTPKNGV